MTGARPPTTSSAVPERTSGGPCRAPGPLKTTETTSLGAAYLAGLAVGLWENQKELPPLARRPLLRSGHEARPTCTRFAPVGKKPSPARSIGRTRNKICLDDIKGDDALDAHLTHPRSTHPGRCLNAKERRTRLNSGSGKLAKNGLSRLTWLASSCRVSAMTKFTRGLSDAQARNW